jgi:hypothetical protein
MNDSLFFDLVLQKKNILFNITITGNRLSKCLLILITIIGEEISIKVAFRI